MSRAVTDYFKSRSYDKKSLNPFASRALREYEQSLRDFYNNTLALGQSRSVMQFLFLDQIQTLPVVLNTLEAEQKILSLRNQVAKIPNSQARSIIEEVMADSRATALLLCIFAHSPYLTRLVQQMPEFFAQLCQLGQEHCLDAIKVAFAPADSTSQLMHSIRSIKRQSSLIIALADIAGTWPLHVVTAAMSDIAELCVSRTLAWLLLQASHKGEVILHNVTNPEESCGLFVLGMGKLGGKELNYSSDIDLIVFFDKDVITYQGSSDSQQFYIKLTKEMIRILQERTELGYGFRVDLRLRPDPSSTPVAMSTLAAITYYETVGQNWERAAFIKARVIAGDKQAGELFLKQITPFLWRKHLDFAAIADIQSIKRQMDAHTHAKLTIPGHNVKTGLGGIREIEFYAQIQQLIWGGRIASLRTPNTCKALEILADTTLISESLKDDLTASYHFLRQVEHRLQMVDDQQTHTIPLQPEAIAQLAAFMGYHTTAEFEEVLLSHLQRVHENFSESFRGDNTLGASEGTLSFTGVENDPGTIKTLREIGYANPGTVCDIIQAWHRGSRRATRTKRARELITEITPALLKALATTPYPDQAFLHFDEFLTRLPAGVQLFSLFLANPHLLELVALIMGAAPRMAESLSKHPNLLDTVLTSEFYLELPDEKALCEELSGILARARDFEDEMDMVRLFKNEKQFQAGMQLIRHQIDAFTTSRYLSRIANCTIGALQKCVEKEMKEKYPELITGNFAIIALGRLGAEELTFGSDLDLLFVYDDNADDSTSSHILYNKLGQRFISAITTLTREGTLYEVDTRLRPSGKNGPLAVSLETLDKYYAESAWTYEFMALSRARVITGNAAFKERITACIHSHLLTARSPAILAEDIHALRAKIVRGFGENNPWDLKYAKGGVLELDFLAQFLALTHVSAASEVMLPSSAQIFNALAHHHLLSQESASALIAAHQFLHALQTLLRLCGGGNFDEATAPKGLKHLITTHMGTPNLSHVKAQLMEHLKNVHHYFMQLVV